VELKTFIDDNEKIKKHQEEKQELNEILLHNMAKKIKSVKLEGNKETSRQSSQKSSRESKSDERSSRNTQPRGESQTTSTKKRK